MEFGAQIIDVINFLCQKLGIAIDWTSESVMPYLQELATKFISWEIATSQLWFWVGATAVVVGIVLIVIEAITGWTGGTFYILAACLIMVGVPMVGCQVYDILTCIHFPEKMVLEYVQNLMQSQ